MRAHIGGDQSGASQPHKHVQLLPLENGSDGPPIERLARATTVDRPGAFPCPTPCCATRRLTISHHFLQIGPSASRLSRTRTTSYASRRGCSPRRPTRSSPHLPTPSSARLTSRSRPSGAHPPRPRPHHLHLHPRRRRRLCSRRSSPFLSSPSACTRIQAGADSPFRIHLTAVQS